MTNDLLRGARHHATAMLEHGRAKGKVVDKGNGDAQAKAIEEIALTMRREWAREACHVL